MDVWAGGYQLPTTNTACSVTRSSGSRDPHPREDHPHERDPHGAEFPALAARHLVTPGTDWDQGAYDRITHEYRAYVGKLHPEDADLRNPTITAWPTRGGIQCLNTYLS